MQTKDLWRSTYKSVLPGYHQNKEHWNKEHWNTVILENEIKRMIAESYELFLKKK